MLVKEKQIWIRKVKERKENEVKQEMYKVG